MPSSSCPRPPVLWTALSALLLWLLSSLLLAAPLQLQTLSGSIGLEPWVSYSCDGPRPRQFPEIQHAKLQPLTAPHIAFGFRRDACWFHWRVENTGAQTLELLLIVDYPVLDHADLHILENGTIQTVHAGDALPFHNRRINSRNFVTPQTLAPGSGRDYYLRVASSGSMTVPLRLVTRDHYLGEHEIQEWGVGIFYGISLGLLFYHGFLWLVVREKIYRFFVLHVSSSLLYMATLQGLAYRLWPEWIEWNNRANYLGGYLLMLTGVLFARDYLGTRNWKRGDQFLITLAWLIFMFLPAQLVLSVQSLYDTLAKVAIVTMALLLLTGLLRWRQGVQEARLFVLAWGMFMLMAIIFVLRTRGFFTALPLPGTLNAMQLGIILQQVLLAMGMAGRINTLKAEKAQQVQEVLRERAESEAKSNFMATMSHEIRTPMNAVLGLTQLLKDGPLGQTQRQQINMLHSAGQSLLDIINDILDYSKISAGKLQLERTTFNLHLLFNECANMFAVNAAQKSLTLAFEPAARLPEWVGGDPVRLRQIIGNLLGNAIKFTNSGCIYLRARMTPAPQLAGSGLR